VSQNNQTFTLVGQFQDNITPKLKKLTASFDRLSKSLEKSFAGSTAKMTKDFDRFEKKFNTSTSRMIKKSDKEFRNFGKTISNTIKSEDAYDQGLRNFGRYRDRIANMAKRPIKGAEIVNDMFSRENESSSGRGRGGGSSRLERQSEGFFGDVGDGFSIDKGIIAGLAVEGITRIMDMLVGSVTGALGYLKGTIQERVQDEMSDIKSAGGIFSIAKDKKIAFADTFAEATVIQKKLNSEMAELAAALPGTTNDYVRNMKMVTDTSMKAVATDTKGMIAELNNLKKLGIAGIGDVKTDQDAFVHTTKQLAKFSTLAEQGSSGGTPFTMLMEQIIGADQVNISGMKRRYSQLRDPLLSGALEDFQAEMNKFAAGTPQRIGAMMKAMNKAFPPEVIAAMEKSADGIFQAMKSYISNPDVGLFGLGRIIEMDFSKFDTGGLTKVKESMSVFDLFVRMFGALGQVLGPILAELPKIIEVFDPLIEPMKEFYVNAQNTVSNLNAAKKGFAKLGKSLPAFRASLFTIGKLAMSFGGDAKKFNKLDQLLKADKLDLGAALRAAIEVLFSSEAMQRIGTAIGESLGGFFKLLAGIAETGTGLVDQSGLMKGFGEGWKASGGTDALRKIVRKVVKFLGVSIVKLFTEAIKTEPLGVGIVTVLFVAPIRKALLDWMRATSLKTAATIKAASMARVPPPIAAPVLRLSQAQKLVGAPPLVPVPPVPPPAALGGLGAVTIVGWIVALTAAFVLFEKPLMGFAGMLKNFGVKMTESENLLTSSLGYVLKGLGQLLSGLTMFFNGLWEVVSNLLSGEPDKVRAGIAKLMQGVVQIFLGIGNTIGGLGGVIVTAIRNLFTTIAALITGSKPGAGPTVSTVTKNKKTGQVNANLNQNQVVAPGRAEAKGSPGKYFSSLEGAIGYENKHKPPGSDLVIANSSETIIPAFKGLNVDGNLAKANYEKTHSSETMVPNFEGLNVDGNLAKANYEKTHSSETMVPNFEGLNVDGNLAKAINFEMANKPPSSDLVVANSSETIIPAANGLNAGMNMDGVISAIFSAASNTASTMATGFMSLNNTLKANQARNEQVIRSSAANTQAAIRQSTIMSMQGDRQILAAIKTASAAGGMFGGAMGTGKGSLGSAEAMARSMGLETTSGYRRGDPGYHGANRARDFSNGTGPTPQMMAYAQKMVGAYGTSLTELIYTPLGYSIKNGKKVAPYAQAAHYNHVHVAFGRGMGNPTMFSNANAAVAYESMMAPAGATISSVTANSSEFGGEKGTMNLTQNISVSGALDPKATAEAVWAYTTQAVDRLRYNNYG